MGHRANYVLKYDSHCELYYAHWGAQVIDRDLFWGPERAERFIKMQTPATEVLSEVWCEGGAGLDFEQQKLVIFGGLGLWEPFKRAAWLSLVRESWHPWQVEWAHGGVLDLATLASLSADDVLEHDRVERFLTNCGSIPQTSPEHPWCGSILQVDGELYFFRYDEGLLCHGPAILETLEPSYLGPYVNDAPPLMGGIVDTRNKELVYWDQVDGFEYRDGIEQAWLGWQVRHQDLGFEYALKFLNAAGHSPPDWNLIVSELEEHLLTPPQSQALTMDTLGKALGVTPQGFLTPQAARDVRPTRDLSAERAKLEAILLRVKPVF